MRKLDNRSFEIGHKLRTDVSHNRRGQEGLTLTTLLLIVLGIVVVVVLIIGFTRGFDFIFGKVDILPGQDLQAVAESCIVAANAELLIDYCSFKEVSVEGKDQLVNCEDARLQESIDAKLAASKTKPDCPINTESDRCASLINAENTDAKKKDICDGKDVLVNNKACRSIYELCSSYS